MLFRRKEEANVRSRMRRCSTIGASRPTGSRYQYLVFHLFWVWDNVSDTPDTPGMQVTVGQGGPYVSVSSYFD